MTTAGFVLGIVGVVLTVLLIILGVGAIFVFAESSGDMTQFINSLS